MKASISEIKAFQECPMSWYLKYVIKKQKRGRSELALNVGSYGHAVLESHYGQARSTEEILGDLMETNKTNEKWLDELDKIDYTLDWFLNRYNFPISRVLEVEAEHEVAIGMHQVPTKTDLVGLDSEKRLWHVQWKFLSDRTDLANYCGVQERAMHEATYRIDLTTRYPQYDYMGTKLFIFLKRAIHTREKGASCTCDPPKAGYTHKDPSRNLHVEDLLINPERQKRAERNITYWINEMDMMREREIWAVPQSESACLGKFGACQYNPYCNDEAPLENIHMWETVDPHGHYQGVKSES